MIQPTIGHIREDSPRADEWRAVFGSTEIPLKSLLTVENDSPAGVRQFYLVDVAKLDEDQLERVVAHVADKFGIAKDAVAADLNSDHGLPILADDVLVSFDQRLVL